MYFGIVLYNESVCIEFVFKSSVLHTICSSATPKECNLFVVLFVSIVGLSCFFVSCVIACFYGFWHPSVLWLLASVASVAFGSNDFCGFRLL